MEREWVEDRVGGERIGGKRGVERGSVGRGGREGDTQKTWGYVIVVMKEQLSGKHI